MSIMAAILKVNNPFRHDQGMVHLEELHTGIDRAVLTWDDPGPEYGFYQNEQGQVRFTMSPEAQRKVLRRLLELNPRLSG